MTNDMTATKRCKACGRDVYDGVVRCEDCVLTARKLTRRVPMYSGPDDLWMDTQDMVYVRLPDGSLRRIGRLNRQ